MCPHTNGDVHPNDEMVPVDVSSVPPVSQPVPANGTNGHTNGTSNGQTNRLHRPTNPYAPRYADFLSNVSNFKIIESTLRGRDSLYAIL
jgi:homocitrate synthase